MQKGKQGPLTVFYKIVAGRQVFNYKSLFCFCS